MTGSADPYRTLGLSPGASENEIRSAYRRLVKQVHPDRAGERMLPRFLAVQAAYEQLIDGEGHLRARPGAGMRPAARPAARPSGAGGTPGWRADPERARATREAYRARRAGAAPDDTSGETKRSTPPPPRDGSPHRPRRATHGSTSYDDAHETPFEPEWSGGSWYGESSGTFWTVNPKEFADPRKHGPEYQARARRGTGARRSTAPRPDPENGAGAPSEPAPASEPAPGPRPRPQPQTAPPPPAAAGPDIEAFIGRLAPERLLAIATRTGRRGRLLVALAGWPPVGWALATVLDALTGCGTYAARCTPEQDALAVLVQPLVILVLFAAPAAAAMAAFSCVAALAIGIPVAIVLSAGTLPQPSEGKGALVVVTTLAYVAAAAVAARRLSRLPPARTPGGDPDAPQAQPPRP